MHNPFQANVSYQYPLKGFQILSVGIKKKHWPEIGQASSGTIHILGVELRLDYIIPLY